MRAPAAGPGVSRSARLRPPSLETGGADGGSAGPAEAMFVARSIAADHKDLIHDVSFDFHGRRMATCSSDQSVKVCAEPSGGAAPGRRGSGNVCVLLSELGDGRVQVGTTPNFEARRHVRGLELRVAGQAWACWPAPPSSLLYCGVTAAAGGRAAVRLRRAGRAGGRGGHVRAPAAAETL